MKLKLQTYNSAFDPIDTECLHSNYINRYQHEQNLSQNLLNWQIKLRLWLFVWLSISSSHRWFQLLCQDFRFIHKNTITRFLSRYTPVGSNEIDGSVDFSLIGQWFYDFSIIIYCKSQISIGSHEILKSFLLLWLSQALGIKGKMFAKKRYAEKTQMKKTLVSLLYFYHSLSSYGINFFLFAPSKL